MTKTAEEYLERIADALEQMLYDKKIIAEASKVIKVLKEEDSVKTTLQVDSKVYDGLEVKEEVLMNLSEVTIMVVTDKAIMVVKRGYQKWIPKSQIKDSDAMTFEEGKFVENIPLTDKAEKWIPNESWEKYEVKKR